MGRRRKTRPKEEPPLPPATPLVAAPEKRRPEKRPGGCKGEEKADVQEEGREGKTALSNPEEEHELEISLKSQRAGGWMSLRAPPWRERKGC